jgi:hypothetical protein
MAYQGTTELSSVANPPRLLIPRFGGLPNSTQLSTAVGQNPWREQAGALWGYWSSHSTEVMSSNFFTDAKALGMRPGDIVMVVGWTTLGSTVNLTIGVVRHVSSDGGSLTTGGSITSTFA